MKSLLEQTDELDTMLRSINKMIAKLESTQIPAIFRELNRLKASLDKSKRELIEDSDNRNSDSFIFSESDRGNTVEAKTE